MAKKKIASAEEKALQVFREKQERKYGKIAKKRLAIVSEKLELNKLVVDMTNEEFDTFIEMLLAYQKAYNHAHQQPVADSAQPQQS